MDIPILLFCFWRRWLFSCRLGTGDSTANDRKVKMSLKTSRNEKDSGRDALVLPEIRLSSTEDLSWRRPWEAEEGVCDWLNHGFKDVHILISRTWECYLT